MSDCKLIEMQQVEYFLDLLDAEETSELKSHLNSCDGCTVHIKTVRGDFQALARWSDQIPRRDAVVELLQVMGIGPDEDDLQVVMPGESADTSFADELIADISQDAPAAPGLLLGPAVSDDERSRILGEFGIDPETGHHAPRERKDRRKIGLDELEARADEAVARRSGRMTKSQSEDEWGKLAGTTRIMGDTRGPDNALRRDVEDAAATDDAGDTRSKASSAWEKIKSGRTAADKEDILDAAESEADKRRSQRWDAMTGVTQIGGPSDTGEFKPEIDLSELDEEDEEVEALMGTTILSKPAVNSKLMPRYQSTVLRKIKSEDEKVRKIKRAAKQMKARTPAWVIGFGVHIAAAFIMLAIVWAVPKNDVAQYIVHAPEEPPLPPDEEVEPEWQDEFEEADIEEETDQASDEEADVADREMLTAAGAKVNPNKREVESEPFRAPREGRGKGTGGRGGGPIAAVEAGLSWLAKHQSPDGSWEWKNHVTRCENHPAPACDHGITSAGDTPRNFTPGLSGLCTLAFLASAYHHADVHEDATSVYRARHAKYQANMKAAIAYLLSQQDLDGAIGRKSRGGDNPDAEDPEGYMYNHAIGTLALCDAFALTADKALLEPAQRAIDFLQRAQDPKYGGWDYFPFGHLPADARAMGKTYANRSDLSITGWAVMALKVARNGGLKVKPKTMNAARGFVRSMSRGDNPEPQYARGWFQGYSKGAVEQALKEAEEHDLTFRKKQLGRILKDLNNNKPAEPRRGVAMTSVAAVAGLFLGESPDSPTMRKRLTHMLGNAPSAKKLVERRPGVVNHSHSYYYWYHGTLAFWNVDDVRWNQWWDENLKGELLGLQVTQGPAAGSWPPVDPVYGDYAGRLYSTSLSILTLEVFYRYTTLAKRDTSDLLADLSYDELRADLEGSLKWLRTPRGDEPDLIRDRTVAAMEKLRRAVWTVRKQPKIAWRRAETVAGLFQQVATLVPPNVPDTASAAEKVPLAAAAKTIHSVRRIAVTELGRMKTHYSAKACADLVRHFARTDKALALRALAVLEKRLARVAYPEHQKIVAQVCSDPGTPADLKGAGGRAYNAIQRELDKKAKARANARAK